MNEARDQPGDRISRSPPGDLRRGRVARPIGDRQDRLRPRDHRCLLARRAAQMPKYRTFIVTHRAQRLLLSHQLPPGW